MFANSNIVKSAVAIIVILAVYLIIPLPSPLFNTDYSQIITDEDGEYLRVFLNDDEQWCFPPQDTIDVPQKLKQAIINFEDKYFNWHWGINPISLARAFYQNITEGKIVSGASTITMQVARLRNQKPRTVLNKLLEILTAVKIEFHYSKGNILKAYLDHAPFGGNIKGYRAASVKYFNKPPKALSWSEAATLAVLPNAPGLVTPNSSSKTLAEKRNRLLRKLLQANEIDESTYRLALKEPVLSNKYSFKITSPHLTRKIAKENRNSKVIKTTINIEQQQYVELLAKQYIGTLKKEGIRNCSVIILETKTGKIKTYVGSNDYFDFSNQGMVDGVLAKRSSGSILKPFLYALSIDDGIIIPQTLIKDIPSFFDAFSPQNADSKFNGAVTAKEALISSLNIPAVRLLNTYGIFSFYSFLKSTGLTTLFRLPEDYGLPLIIGGAEVNLLEMTMLYRGLANNGVFQRPYYIAGEMTEEKGKGSKLISSGSCFLTLEMLKELKRPGAEHYWQQFQNQKPIAWKTGTSYGGKDAWAVGVNPDWTIGVWVGNFDGEANPNLSGVGSAGPLLFEVLNYLPETDNNNWFEKIDSEFRTVKVCKQTGFLAGSYCDEYENIDVPVNMFPLRLCPFHKNTFIDREYGFAVCSNCWGSEYDEKHILVYPSDVLYYLKNRGQVIPDIPVHNPKCNRNSGHNPLQILYPLELSKIWMPREYGGDLQKLVLKVAHNKSATNIFWYMDNEYLGSTETKHEKSVELGQGWHKLLVVDKNGYKDEVKFFISRIN